jgi:hypothetical protein
MHAPRVYLAIYSPVVKDPYIATEVISMQNMGTEVISMEV